jgi:hypothetical protein
LIQILRIKNPTRAVPLFSVQTAAGVNSISEYGIGAKWARGLGDAAISAAKAGFSGIPRFTRR